MTTTETNVFVNDAERDQLEFAVLSFNNAKAHARDSLSLGQKFLGAYGVADAIVAARDTMAWKFAMTGAYNEFQKWHIFTDAAGIITALEQR